jgi:alpha-L-fucosidase
VITTKWKKEIEVEGIKNTAKVSMPGFAGPVRIKKNGGKLVITAPEINPANMPCQYAWVYKVSSAF